MSNNNEVKTNNELNDLQMNQISNNFDFYKDFELKDKFDLEISEESKKKSTNIDVEKENELNNIISSLPLINDNIRININLSIEIYKKLNNFDHKYIHNIINEKLSNN